MDKTTDRVTDKTTDRVTDKTTDRATDRTTDRTTDSSMDKTTDRATDTAMKTAVVGCGAISDIYLTNMINRFSNLEVVSCCASHLEHAREKAEKYGIRACTYEEILADPEIELIVNLTPAPAHYDLIRRALLAGKHVYTEKTMTVTLEEAKELVRLADEKGLYLCSAPDTFLGASLQTARKAIDEGMIGEVTSCVVYGNRDLNLLASICSFLRMPGGGICFDYGVYYMTGLVSLLGPVRRVAGTVRNPWPKRRFIIPDTPDYGKVMDYPNETQVSALLEFESGITGTFHLNGDSNLVDETGFVIFGTKGVLKLANPNHFGGQVSVIPNSYDHHNPPKPQALDYGLEYEDNSRGIGPAEMALAVREGRKARTDKELAYHVLEVLCGIVKSSARETFIHMESTCSRPEPMIPGLIQ